MLTTCDSFNLCICQLVFLLNLAFTIFGNHLSEDLRFMRKRNESFKHVNVAAALSAWMSSEARGAAWLVRACSSAPWPFLSPPLAVDGSGPSLTCILGSLGGVLPARSRGMQPTRRPNEIVSLQRIVTAQFRLHSGAWAHAPAVWSAPVRLQLYMTSSAVWFPLILRLCYPVAKRGCFSLVSCTDSRVWHALSSCIQKMLGAP